MGARAAEFNVADLAWSPTSQSGSFARHLDSALGLDVFGREYVFWAQIPQYERIPGRELLPHPFLLPHRQIDAYADSSIIDNQEILSLPIHAELSLVKEKGPLALLRIYVDGVDTGGKSRKVAKKVYVFTWTPVDKTHSIQARRIITVLLDNRCCRTCGCGGKCTVNAVWKVCCWSWAALRDVGGKNHTPPFLGGCCPSDLLECCKQKYVSYIRAYC